MPPTERGPRLRSRARPCPRLRSLLAKLGLGIGIDLPPGEIAEGVLRSGRPQRFRGQEDLILKRSLVIGSQHLELTGFGASRLAWYKVQGCFTEIIRYQTRLFVPVNQAAEVLARLAAELSQPL